MSVKVDREREATRIARTVSVGGKEHVLEAVFETVTEGGRGGQGRYTVDGVKVPADDFDRVLRLAAAA